MKLVERPGGQLLCVRAIGRGGPDVVVAMERVERPGAGLAPRALERDPAPVLWAPRGSVVGNGVVRHSGLPAAVGIDRVDVGSARKELQRRPEDRDWRNARLLAATGGGRDT